METRELSFFTGRRGARLLVGGGGDQNFLGWSKGRPVLHVQRGDQKKLATGHHRQTAPSPGEK